MRLIILGLAVILSLFTAFESIAGYIEVQTGSGPIIRRRVTSLKELKYRRIVSQTIDYSCGAAALATLLKYHFGINVTEKQIVTYLLKGGDQELIRKKGFSLLDIKRFAERIGYRTAGYKIKPEILPKITIPAIVLINSRGYSHFVVFKKMIGEKVFLADPARGNRTMQLKHFLKVWNNIILLIDGLKVGQPEGLYMKKKWVASREVLRMERIDLSFLKNPIEF